MGGPGSGRFPKKAPGTRLGHGANKGVPHSAARDGGIANNSAANASTQTKPEANIGPIGVAQPNASSQWHPIVQAWWRALGKSAIHFVAQPADWMNAWVAADVLDHMYNYGFTAGMLQTWVVMADRLHAPHFEQFDVPDAEAPEEDSETRTQRAAKVRNLFAVGDDD